MLTDCDVLIIGAGVAGLACAAALRDDGLRVVLVEKLTEPCGRARSFPDAVTGDRTDLGPHVLITEYVNLLSLLDTFGTDDQIVWHRDELITLVSRSGATPMRLSPLPPPLHLVPSMLKVRDVSLRDQLSNTRAVWLAMRARERDLMQLDSTSAADLLGQLGVSRRFRDWFWRSTVLSLLNVPLEECSGAAMMRVFSQLITHSGFSFGFPAGALDELFWPAAKRVLVGHCDIRFGAIVESLTYDGGKCTGARLTDGSTISATHTVSCLPPAELLDVLPPSWKRDPAFWAVRRFRSSPYISVFHWLDRKVTAQRFWTQVWDPSNLNCDFYDLSNIREGWSARSSVIASNIVHSVGIEDASDDDISERTLGETARYAPAVLDAHVMHRRIHRIPMAIPSPRPGTETARPSTRTSFPGLLLAGDWTNTSLPACMESAARSGFLAAEQTLAAVGRPRKIAKMPSPPQGLAGWVHRLSSPLSI